MKRPRVVVVTRRTGRKNRLIDYVGEHHLELLLRLKLLPVMVPVVRGTLACLSQYTEGISGLLLVEGEDVEPKRYRAQKANFEYVEKTHPLKDEVEIRLLQHALRQRMPILGICRGSQLLNVVSGGTLHGDVQREKQSTLKHIEKTKAGYDTYRHRITLAPHSPLRRWYGQEHIRVNSYHHQGVRKLASRFAAMAQAEDGLIEAFYDPKADFVVGLQFHPERMLKEYAGNWRLWKAFGAAVQRQAAEKF